MALWSEITKPEGIYESEVFDISNNLDKYIATIDIESINIHHQKLDFYYSLSEDSLTWTDWKSFQAEQKDLFNGYSLQNLYFKYKVVIGSTDDTQKPYLQKISLTLDPYIVINNEGDLITKPKIWIRKTNGDGDISLLNYMTGQKIELKNIRNLEEVYIDFYDEEIISSLQNLGVYRFDDHNDEWLELIRGENYIKGLGDFEMDLRYRYLLLQE